MYNIPKVDYSKYSNKQLASIPLALLALALAVIAVWVALTGAPANLGLPFVGGTEVRLAVDASSPAAAEQQINQAFGTDPVNIRAVASEDVYVATFQAGSVDAATIQAEAESAGFEVRSINTVSPSFGANTQQTALTGLAFSFIGMSILVFLLFRSVVPSVAVVVSAFSDIVVPIAAMNLLGISLNLGTVAALLMLIGYSVDSDILLTDHVLRQPGDFIESVHRAMETGVTMTITSLAAMIVLSLTATFFGIDLLSSIGFVLAIGLATDLLNTYMLNLSLLRWYKTEGVGA